VPPLAAMIRSAATRTQVVVITHAAALVAELAADSEVALYKEWGETRVDGQTMLTAPRWDWGKR
jgi:predicted ATPase